MKNSKKLISLLMALLLVFSLVACGNNENKENNEDNNQTESNEGENNTGESKKLGVLFFNGSDPYIGTVRQAMEEIDKSDDEIELDIQDSQNDQAKQNDQLDALIAKGVDGLLINIVDFGAGAEVIQKVKDSGIPTVFFNRDITKDMSKDDLEQLVFFGTLAPEAGVIQGKIALNKWKENGDTNNDGKLQYVTLHGGLDNAEAVARSTESVKVFTDDNVEVEELDTKVANWDDTQAKEATDAWIARFGDQIEVIFANNDGMAIGALNALQQAGYNVVDADGNVDNEKYIPVYGVDATAQAVEKVESGELSGTVKQDNEKMANGVLDLIKNKLNDKDWVDGTDYEIYEEDGVSVRMNYEEVTQ